MKAKKSDRSIAGMEVLKDIRGLLSTTQGGATPTEAQAGNEDTLRAETARLQQEIGSYKELVQKQQEELQRLEREKKELAARLILAASGKDKTLSPAQAAQELSDEIAQLEERKAELSAALSEIEGLLQLKVKDLLRRIARLYDEAGQGEIALEFRRVGNELQVAANFASFLRALLRQ